MRHLKRNNQFNDANRHRSKISMRPVLLLEIMIAFTIVLLCAFPLLYPHFQMVKMENQATRSIELDRLAGFIYADLIVKLYRQEVPWDELITPNVQHDIKKLNLSPALVDQLATTQYTGHYSFEQLDRKPPADKQNNQVSGGTTHHIIKVIFSFAPTQDTTARTVSFERCFYVQRTVMDGQKLSADRLDGG